MSIKRLSGLHAVLLGCALVAASCSGADSAEPSDDGPATSEPAERPAEQPAAGLAQEPAEEPAEEPVDEPTTIVIGTTDSISNLDSADAYAVHDWEIIRNTGEGLTRLVPGTADIIPGIAESWDVSSDSLTWTFRLRDGVTFGDGTLLTADHYVTHIRRMLELDGSGGIGGALGVPYVADVRALDDSTIVFTLHDAVAYFPQVVSGAPYVPSPPSFPTDAIVELPETPFYGVGPWIVTEYDPADRTVLEPNPFYYGDRPQVGRIIIRYFEEAQPLVLALQNGEIDIAWRRVTEPALLEQLADTDGIVSATVLGGDIRYLIVNHTMAPSDDPNVNKAIAALVDRDELVDRALGGSAVPLYSPIPPGFIGANEAFDHVYQSPDMDAAIEFLSASGYSADNPLELTLDYPRDRYGEAVADAMRVLQEQLEASGVIKVALEAADWATYTRDVIEGESNSLSLFGWFFSYPDSNDYVEPFVVEGGLGTNVTDAETGEVIFGNPSLVDVLTAAATSIDPVEREALYVEVQDIWAKDVITIPLWFEPERIFYWDHISGDTAGAYAEALNVGPTTDLDYSLLSTSK